MPGNSSRPHRSTAPRPNPPRAKAGSCRRRPAARRSPTWPRPTSAKTNRKATAGPNASQILATRSASGWSTRDITTPNTEGLGALPGNPREYQFFASELEAALLNPEDHAPLSKKSTETNVYLRHNLTCVEDPEECFEPLVTAENDTAGGHSSGLDILGASPDLRHIVIRSNTAALVKGASVPGIYELTGGELTPINFLPHGETTKTLAFLGAGSTDGNPIGRMTLTAISHDGGRVEWYAENNPHLYSRDVPMNETLQVDELATGVSAPAKELPALFQTANADGSKIFFTDAERLTTNSKASENQAEPDLYVFEPEKRPGARVTDLSVPLAEHEGGDVQGAVVGTSEDGSLVYFVADGKLAGNASPGNCGQPGASGCNLYVEHDGENGWEKPELVARVSSKDAPDWGLPNTLEANHLQYKTSEVSPNGQYVAFMSENSLTGYDNIDVNSEARDEEVFLYDNDGEGSAKLACASCNPTGAQPERRARLPGRNRRRRRPAGGPAIDLDAAADRRRDRPVARRQPPGLDGRRAVRHQLPAALSRRLRPPVLQQSGRTRTA